MTQPTMTEVHVTLQDVWRLLESMDRSMNERFDRLERQLAAMATRVNGFDSSIGAQLDALKAKLDESPR
jgi:hypothetical protein